MGWRRRRRRKGQRVPQTTVSAPTVSRHRRAIMVPTHADAGLAKLDVGTGWDRPNGGAHDRNASNDVPVVFTVAVATVSSCPLPPFFSLANHPIPHASSGLEDPSHHPPTVSRCRPPSVVAGQPATLTIHSTTSPRPPAPSQPPPLLLLSCNGLFRTLSMYARLPPWRRHCFCVSRYTSCSCSRLYVLPSYFIYLFHLFVSFILMYTSLKIQQ